MLTSYPENQKSYEIFGRKQSHLLQMIKTIKTSGTCTLNEMQQMLQLFFGLCQIAKSNNEDLQ